MASRRSPREVPFFRQCNQVLKFSNDHLAKSLPEARKEAVGYPSHRSTSHSLAMDEDRKGNPQLAYEPLLRGSQLKTTQ
jgi:hypothetical protein